MVARSLLALLVLVTAACATNTAGGADPSRRNPHALTREEIQAANAPNAYDLVARLRPQWIRSRGAQSIQDPTAGQVNIYLDGVRAGGAEYLRQLNTIDLESIQYLDAIQAAARFGLATNGGAALLIRLRTGR